MCINVGILNTEAAGISETWVAAIYRILLFNFSYHQQFSETGWRNRNV
jgi:hypothetical protein